MLEKESVGTTLLEETVTQHKEEQGAKDSLQQTVGYADTRAYYYRQLSGDPRDTEEFWDEYEDPEQLDQVEERLALYRIKAHELFWEGKELDVAQIKQDYSSDRLRDEGYFERYEINREWYFDPEYCRRSALDDYQRLVLRNDVGTDDIPCLLN